MCDVYYVYTVTNAICPSLLFPRLAIFGASHLVGSCGVALVPWALKLGLEISTMVIWVDEVHMHPTITP